MREFDLYFRGQTFFLDDKIVAKPAGRLVKPAS